MVTESGKSTVPRGAPGLTGQAEGQAIPREPVSASWRGLPFQGQSMSYSVAVADEYFGRETRASAPRLTHRQEMFERRARQLAREPGFTPIVGERQAAAINAAAYRFQQAWPAMSQQDLIELAVRDVARGYPPRPFARQLRAPRPSKSDDPAYRNPALRA